MTFSRAVSVSFAALLAFVGCSTIEEARLAQGEVAAKGDETARSSCGKVALSDVSLEGLVDFALTNRASMVSASLAVESARLQLKSLAADAPLVSDSPWTSPRLSISGNYGESSSGSAIGDLDISTRGNPSAGLSLDLPIWDFGRYEAEARAQAERVTAAELELVNTGYGVFYEVSGAYFSLLEKAALFEVAMTNEIEYAVHLERAEDLLESGESVKLDVLKARYDLSAAVENRIAASNAMVSAEVEMMRSLGLDIASVDLKEFDSLCAGALAMSVQAFDETDYTADAAFELARTNSPTVKIARSRLRASSHDVDFAVADLLPNVSVSASVSWTDPLWYWNWGIGAAQTLFQGFRKTTAVERAVIAMKSAAAEVDDREQRLSADIALAVTTRDNAKEALVTTRSALERAKENLETVRHQYEIGEASRVDCTDAVSVYVEELGNGVRAFYRGQLAEAALFNLLGEYPVYHKETK